MTPLLDGQVAIVSGGGRGIGLAIAKALAEAGAGVAVVARSEPDIDAVASALRNAGGRAVALAADVTDAARIREVVDRTERPLGSVTLLVNNAGTPGPVGTDWEVDGDDWWRCVEVSVRGAFVCSQAVLPRMLTRGRGRIINVASGIGVGPRAFLTGPSAGEKASNITIHRAGVSNANTRQVDCERCTS
jgi:NAD(P)-dependent dehydrogenase (short-subunit alcohol dehydrogenase family)